MDSNLQSTDSCPTAFQATQAGMVDIPFCTGYRNDDDDRYIDFVYRIVFLPNLNFRIVSRSPF
jgi:hypothetical protein